jgi:hypothetical protein
MLGYRAELENSPVLYSTSELLHLLQQHAIPWSDIIQNGDSKTFDFNFDVKYTMVSHTHLIDPEWYTMFLLSRYLIHNLQVYNLD